MYCRQYKKLIIWPILFCLVIFTTYGLCGCMTLKGTELNSKEFILQEIERSIYANDYTDYDLYTFAIETQGTGSASFKLADSSNQKIVELRCAKLEYEPYEIDIIVDKSKIATSYWSDFSIQDIMQIIDGKISAHELVIKKLYQERPITLAKDPYQEKYYWMDVEIEPLSKALNIDFISNLSSEKDINGLISSDHIWNQLTQSKLNLDNTKAMMTFGFQSGSFGIIFFDGYHEYYMGFDGHLFTMAYSDLMVEPSLSEITKARLLNAYQLYDLRTELAPLIVEQYKIEMESKDS